MTTAQSGSEHLVVGNSTDRMLQQTTDNRFKPRKFSQDFLVPMSLWIVTSPWQSTRQCTLKLVAALLLALAHHTPTLLTPKVWGRSLENCLWLTAWNGVGSC